MAVRAEVVVGGVGIGIGAGLLGVAITRVMEARHQAHLLELVRRQRTLEQLQFFIDRAQEYDWRMRNALAAPVHFSPQLAAIALQDVWGFLGAITRWVHHNITWTRDWENSGAAEHWQSPEVTFATRRGDCEDMSLLALRLFQQAGITSFRVVVGVWNGGGHAWLESLDDILVDPVPGIVVRGRPSDYQAALILSPVTTYSSNNPGSDYV